MLQIQLSLKREKGQLVYADFDEVGAYVIIDRSTKDKRHTYDETNASRFEPIILKHQMLVWFSLVFATALVMSCVNILHSPYYRVGFIANHGSLLKISQNIINPDS